jgi:hypothetical protein
MFAPLFLFASTVAQSPASENPSHLDAAARNGAIESVLTKIEQMYFFPDAAGKMVQSVRERAARKEYDSIVDGVKLAERLTQDLQAVGKDKHIRVHFSKDVLPPDGPAPGMSADKEAGLRRKMLERINFGIPKVEVLTGNIGYVRIDLLAPPDLAGDTYAAAMNAVANTNALILDLRWCGGAISPHAIPMLTGYFFQNPVHLIDMQWGRDAAPTQSWSSAYVPGKRYTDKPLFVLTSKRTFSGAEELAYDLQNLKRATLVGETTGGGANPGGIMRANDHFCVFVPVGQVTSPVTKSNWEGVGVKPDVATGEADALARAHRLALEKAQAGAKDDEERQWLKEAMEAVAKETKP